MPLSAVEKLIVKILIEKGNRHELWVDSSIVHKKPRLEPFFFLRVNSYLKLKLPLLRRDKKHRYTRDLAHI